MTEPRNADFEYDVCLSFAGEDRKYVESVANHLQEEGVRVFYDAYEETRLWGKNLYEHLDSVYRTRARYCVVFISKSYEQKLWTRHELKSAQARAFQENREYILPARFDDTELPGILNTVAYVDLRNHEPADFAATIRSKIDSNDADQAQPRPAPRPSSKRARMVRAMLLVVAALSIAALTSWFFGRETGLLPFLTQLRPDSSRVGVDSVSLEGLPATGEWPSIYSPEENSPDAHHGEGTTMEADFSEEPPTRDPALAAVLDSAGEDDTSSSQDGNQELRISEKVTEARPESGLRDAKNDDEGAGTGSEELPPVPAPVPIGSPTRLIAASVSGVTIEVRIGEGPIRETPFEVTDFVSGPYQASFRCLSRRLLWVTVGSEGQREAIQYELEEETSSWTKPVSLPIPPGSAELRFGVEALK